MRYKADEGKRRLVNTNGERGFLLNGECFAVELTHDRLVARKLHCFAALAHNAVQLFCRQHAEMFEIAQGAVVADGNIAKSSFA